MRELDIQYPIHREEFLKQMSKQMTLLSMGYDGDDFKGKKRGRKPTKLSKKNLISEGVKRNLISVTGNTVIDALYWVLKRIDKDKEHRDNVESVINNNLFSLYL